MGDLVITITMPWVAGYFIISAATFYIGYKIVGIALKRWDWDERGK